MEVKMKVGTMPGVVYDVKGPAPVKVGSRVVFKEREPGAKWEEGRVTGMSGDLPLVERM
jgi:hypothetical protein